MRILASSAVFTTAPHECDARRPDFSAAGNQLFRLVHLASAAAARRTMAECRSPLPNACSVTLAGIAAIEKRIFRGKPCGDLAHIVGLSDTFLSPSDLTCQRVAPAPADANSHGEHITIRLRPLVSVRKAMIGSQSVATQLL
jgi:hypothetical protein